MGKPSISYATLKKNHQSSNDVLARDIYKQIGYDYDAMKAQNNQYGNTCALRMSLAFLKSGYTFGTPISRLKVKEGTLKNRFVATGAKTLADELKKPAYLGKPKYTGKAALKAMKTKKGIVLFHKIGGGTGGHIDLVEPGVTPFSDDGFICNSGCHTTSNEIWFWPLD
jgi:hypothetical protein